MTNEALRLADALEDEGASMHDLDGLSLKAAALLRQQAGRIAELEAERDQLRSEVGRLRPDAERYHAFFASALPVCFEGVEHYTKADCDASIDKARTHKDTP